jgi:hypothetical protein
MQELRWKESTFLTLHSCPHFCKPQLVLRDMRAGYGEEVERTVDHVICAASALPHLGRGIVLYYSDYFRDKHVVLGRRLPTILLAEEHMTLSCILWRNEYAEMYVLLKDHGLDISNCTCQSFSGIF